MKYEKLKQICRKGKRYRILGLCCFIPSFIMLVVCIIFGFSQNKVSDTIMAWTLIIGIANIIASIVFSRLECRQYEMAKDYIAIKIMDTVNEYGIDSSKFQLIEECPTRYKIGFHNQMVDYEELQARLNARLIDMNRITGYMTKVELI